MKQIKTVIEPINRVSRFDDKVNRLLEDGWKLTERKTVRTVGDIESSVRRLMMCSMKHGTQGRTL